MQTKKSAESRMSTLFRGRPLKTRFANPSNPDGSRIFAQTLLEKRRKIAIIGQVSQFAPAHAHPISILTPCPLTVVFLHSPFEAPVGTGSAADGTKPLTVVFPHSPFEAWLTPDEHNQSEDSHCGFPSQPLYDLRSTVFRKQFHATPT